MGALASTKSGTDISGLLRGYQFCATTEGKSPSAINIVTYSVNYLEDFLASQEASTDVTRVTRHEIRAFVLYLKQKRCFSNHRFNHTQDKGLSQIIACGSPLFCLLDCTKQACVTPKLSL